MKLCKGLYTEKHINPYAQYARATFQPQKNNAGVTKDGLLRRVLHRQPWCTNKERYGSYNKIKVTRIYLLYKITQIFI